MDSEEYDWYSDNDSYWNSTDADYEYEDPLWLLRHVLPIVCIVGIVGNAMALILIRTNFWLKRLNSNIYLSTLSMSSSIFLCSVFISWGDAFLEGSMYGKNNWGCKINTYTAHFSDFICISMIILISTDRAVVLFRPRARRVICTKWFPRYITLFIIALSLIMYSWVLMFAGLEVNSQGQLYCGLNVDTSLGRKGIRQHYLYFTLIDTLICTVIPSILIILLNTFSTIRYRQYMKIYTGAGNLKVRFVTAPTSLQQQEQLDNDSIHFDAVHAKNYLIKGLIHTETVVEPDDQSPNSMKMRCSDLQLSRTLIIVTSTFVLLNCPSYGMRIAQSIFHLQNNRTFICYNFLAYLLAYCHHAVLFYMYIFWSPHMKKMMKPTAIRLLECYCLKAVPDFGHKSTSSSS